MLKCIFCKNRCSQSLRTIKGLNFFFCTSCDIKRVEMLKLLYNGATGIFDYFNYSNNSTDCMFCLKSKSCTSNWLCEICSSFFKNKMIKKGYQWINLFIAHGLVPDIQCTFCKKGNYKIVRKAKLYNICQWCDNRRDNLIRMLKYKPTSNCIDKLQPDRSCIYCIQFKPGQDSLCTPCQEYFNVHGSIDTLYKSHGICCYMCKRTCRRDLKLSNRFGIIYCTTCEVIKWNVWKSYQVKPIINTTSCVFCHNQVSTKSSKLCTKCLFFFKSNINAVYWKDLLSIHSQYMVISVNKDKQIRMECGYTYYIGSHKKCHVQCDALSTVSVRITSYYNNHRLYWKVLFIDRRYFTDERLVVKRYNHNGLKSNNIARSRNILIDTNHAGVLVWYLDGSEVLKISHSKFFRKK